MSTIVAVRKDDVAAIATDSLTSWGSAKESAEYVVNHEKILRIADSYVAISGPTSAKCAVKQYFEGRNTPDLGSVDSIFSEWLRLHASLKDQFFLNPNENRNDAFESTRIDVLIANTHGIFGVAAHRAVQEFSKYYAYGTGWQLALGAMYAIYGEKELSAEDIARRGVEAAAEFDLDSAAPIICYSLPLSR
ncbi:MAG: hypothetical protein ACLQDV_29465 [Candidatus Binataceae bacterium]